MSGEGDDSGHGFGILLAWVGIILVAYVFASNIAELKGRVAALESRLEQPR